MRKAGRLVAECLNMQVPEIRSGITPSISTGSCSNSPLTKGYAHDADVSRLCQIHLHVKMAASTAT
jgi:hypothetical protein